MDRLLMRLQLFTLTVSWEIAASHPPLLYRQIECMQHILEVSCTISINLQNIFVSL